VFFLGAPFGVVSHTPPPRVSGAFLFLLQILILFLGDDTNPSLSLRVCLSLGRVSSSFFDFFRPSYFRKPSEFAGPLHAYPVHGPFLPCYLAFSPAKLDFFFEFLAHPPVQYPVMNFLQFFVHRFSDVSLSYMCGLGVHLSNSEVF